MPESSSGYIGSSFDAFLESEGILEECTRRALEELAAMEGIPPCEPPS